jgi:hypothetical protein
MILGTKAGNFMRLSRFVTLLLLLSSIAAAAQSDSAKAFDRMKLLAGTWVGKNSEGHAVSDRFQITSAGGSLMSELSADEPMTSMFYMDGDRLMMTHFCPSKNQPRMKATISPDGATITFDFLDATNLATPETGHMHRAVYVLTGPDSLAEEWTWRQNGKETKDRFELHRKP